MSEILYKYRGVKKFKYLNDILENQRLFCCIYKKLNDPMEGIYYHYHSENIDTHNIYGEKENLKICSLSKKRNNPLMWSFYAQEGYGVNIGVEIIDYDLKPINYKITKKDLRIDNLNDITSNQAISILTKKTEDWEYEDEIRIFTTDENDPYVYVRIKEIIFGPKTFKWQRKRIQDIVDRNNLNIDFYHINGGEVLIGVGEPLNYRFFSEQ